MLLTIRPTHLVLVQQHFLHTNNIVAEKSHKVSVSKLGRDDDIFLEVAHHLAAQWVRRQYSSLEEP